MPTPDNETENIMTAKLDIATLIHVRDQLVVSLRNAERRYADHLSTLEDNPTTERIDAWAETANRLRFKINDTAVSATYIDKLIAAQEKN